MSSQNIGDQIRKILMDASESMDYRNLNQRMSYTINEALSDVKENMERARWGQSFDGPIPDIKVSQQTRYGQGYTRTSGTSTSARKGYSQGSAQSAARNTPSSQKPSVPVAASPAGKTSGLVLMVLGILGLIFSGGLGLFSLISHSIFQFAGISVFAVSGAAAGVCAVISLALLLTGVKFRGRYKRFLSYVKLIGNKKYYPLKEFSQAAGKEEKSLLKDLKKMIGLKMFTEAHLDQQETCFISDETTWKEYQRVLEHSKQEQAEAESQRKAREQETAKDRELRETLEKGEFYIRCIRRANDAIPGEEVSAKLDRLESVVREIFARVKAQPSQLPELRKFIEYYLPTTQKLVETYRDFDAQPTQGPQIAAAKAEIEKTLDTIAGAFEQLLDSLFRDAAMDVSADITVLKTLLAQEGLTDQKLFVK